MAGCSDREHPCYAPVNTAGQLICEKSTGEFQNEFHKAVVEHTALMMALVPELEKAGKA